MDELGSRRPYLIRALYEWALDNNCTPHLLVAADAAGVEVPQQFVGDDGRITINISPNAIRGLKLGNDWITFSARFSGRNHDVGIPPGAVLALYARENGEGMLFGDVEASAQTAADGAADAAAEGEESGDDAGARPSHLRIVK